MPARPYATILACLTTIVVSSAAAAAGSPEREWRVACTRDAFAHCPLQALAGDRSGVRDCLVRSLDKISTPCRTVITATRVNDARTIYAAVRANPGQYPR